MHLTPAHSVLVQKRSGSFNNDNDNDQQTHVSPQQRNSDTPLLDQSTPIDIPSFPLVLPSADEDNYFFRVKSAALTEETPVLVHAAGVSSNGSPVSAPAPASAPGEGPLCSRSCLLILGPLSAGLILVALIAGFTLYNRRQKAKNGNTVFKSTGGFHLRTQSTSSFKGKEKMIDDDDLMMEMFEPPELSISPNPRIMEWRNSGSGGGGAAITDPNAPIHSAAAAAMGRNAMLGLSTIMEENMHDQAKDKMFGNIRRKSSHKLTPLRLNSPRGLMRSDRSPMDTPPISPSLSSSAQGSPGLVPFPMGNDSSAANGPPSLYTSGNVNQFLRPAPKKKRKLTIPYNPQDVTRRRSLEGAW